MVEKIASIAAEVINGKHAEFTAVSDEGWIVMSMRCVIPGVDVAFTRSITAETARIASVNYLEKCIVEMAHILGARIFTVTR